MKITQISLEQLFPTGVFQNIRLRAEATIDEGDNITDCYKRLQQEVNKAFDEMNPNYGNVHEIKQVSDNGYEYSGIAMPEQLSTKESELEFEKLKVELDKFTSKQEAFDYLKTTPFKYSIEAKQYIQNKN